jgi:hypothetical protein
MNLEQLNEIEGLQFMPVKKEKIPIKKGWQTFVGKYDLSNCEAVGLVCGKPSGNLEVIDIDCKYDLTGNLFESYKKLIHSVDANLLSKLVVQKTRSNGYHFLYRCAKIEGNVKLANRPTTENEREATFKAEYARFSLEGKDDTTSRKNALKSAENDKVRVLFETRGVGGYVMCFPSEGYELIYGDYYSIREISVEERDTLLSIARQFNSYYEEVKVSDKVKKQFTETEKSPFDDYNERGDVVGLLQNYGWKIVGNKGNKTIFLRPGQTTSQSSGNYDHEKKWFSVFTTSTEFEPQRAYLPYAVFAKLECNDNFSEAAKRLVELGYGEKKKLKEEKKQESPRVTKSRIDTESEDYTFLATNEDYDTYLQQVRDGTLQMGLTTGSPLLDEYFLFKEGNLVMINGHDNVGKTVVILWLFLLAALYHNWKFLIFASENTIGSVIRKLIQFYWGKPLRGTKFEEGMTDLQYKIAKEFIESHFIIIKSQEDLFNYKDIINMTKLTKKKYPDLKATLIDPYNSLKTDISSFSKLGVHDFNYEALSEIKAYGQKNNHGFYINNHAVTESLRKLDKEGYPIAPNKADTEGGGKAANKADDFMTIHRKTQHPTEWMITEIHIRKIKDTETGGKPTQLNSPVKFQMKKNGCGFIEYTEGLGIGIDPIQEWHFKNKQQDIPFEEAPF